VTNDNKVIESDHSESAKPGWREIAVLLRGETQPIIAWTEQCNFKRIALHLGIIIIGAGIYGAAMGWWRAPQQALFVAIKFPLIILLMTFGNALINAMLAPLLGLNIPFRQTLLAILISFTIVAAILGSFSPVVAFFIWNAPPFSPETATGPTYGFIKLMHVLVIAFAGVTGNVRLFQLLTKFGGSKAIARRILFAWLACNLFLGSQLCWILRPFIGAPFLPVAFLRDTAFHGNFYENLLQTLRQILQTN
jgi:hypothetical protein